MVEPLSRFLGLGLNRLKSGNNRQTSGSCAAEER